MTEFLQIKRARLPTRFAPVGSPLLPLDKHIVLLSPLLLVLLDFLVTA